MRIAYYIDCVGFEQNEKSNTNDMKKINDIQPLAFSCWLLTNTHFKLIIKN